MSRGIWLQNLETGEPEFVSYADLDLLAPESAKAIAKPIGHFCYSADKFMYLNLAETPSYVAGGWLPQKAKTMFYGRSKSGKSYLALQLAQCLGAGKPFLGQETTQVKRGVLYLQFEIGERALQGRMLATKHDYERVFVGTTFRMKLDTQQGMATLKAAMEAIKPDVLILDPMYKMLRGDENNSQDVLVVLDALDDVIEAYGCSIVTFHHAGKEKKRGSRGSSVLEDWHEAIIQITRTSETGAPLTIRVEPTMLRHAQEPPEPIEAKLVNEEFVVTENQTTKLLVARYLAAQKQASVANIIANCGGKSRQAVNNALVQLEQEGKVEKQERGIWKWR